MKRFSLLLSLMLVLALATVPCFADEAFIGTETDLNYGEAADAEVYPLSPEEMSPEQKELLSTPLDAAAVADATTGIIGGADGPTAILVSSETDGFGFHPENFVPNLYYMLVGMVGIFIVIGIIVLATMALNKFFSDKPKQN